MGSGSVAAPLSFGGLKDPSICLEATMHPLWEKNLSRRYQTPGRGSGHGDAVVNATMIRSMMRRQGMGTASRGNLARDLVKKQQDLVRKKKVLRMQENELKHEYEDLSLDMVKHQFSVSTIDSPISLTEVLSSSRRASLRS